MGCQVANKNKTENIDLKYLEPYRPVVVIKVEGKYRKIIEKHAYFSSSFYRTY